MAGPSALLTCPRCSGILVRGFIVDEGYGAKSVPKWVEGEPVKSIWSGLKLRGKTQLDVSTYRCQRCGFLESYA